MKKEKNWKKIILISVCCLLLVAVAVIGILLIRSGLRQETYRECIRTAEKYVAEENYEDAVVEYENAIEAVPDEDDAYMGLANVYMLQGHTSQARLTLETGYERTNSAAVKDMLDKINNGTYMNNTPNNSSEKETLPRTGEITWNTAFIQRLENYTYEDFIDEYGNWPDIAQIARGEVKVVHKDLTATLYYSDTKEDDSIVDDEKDEPARDSMPERIELDSISMLFNNFGTPISIEELQNLSSTTLKPVFAEEHTYVEMTTGSVIARIETDASGNIVSETAWNEIILPEANENRNRKGQLNGVVIDAMTGEGVPGAELTFVSAEDPGVTEATVTAWDGSFSVELSEGLQNVTITAADYMEESFQFEMEEGRNYSGEQFIISPELMAGSARIVLEWGAEPQDLDSYLRGETDNGDDVFVNFRSRTSVSGGNTVAELDVDDRDGYGPETITIYDLNGVYRFSVVDYQVTSTLSQYGATVKVYLPNQSSPEVIELDPGAGINNIWEVFELNHGELIVRNEAGDDDTLVPRAK